MYKPKVALIGHGYWGKIIERYVPFFFECKYVADSKFNRDIIWNDKKIDAVIIATPINTHYEISKEAIKAGKHVFVEKPISLHRQEAIELKKLAFWNDVEICVEYTQTFSLAINRMWWVVNEGLIGDVEYIDMKTKHLGIFKPFDVFWLLASHWLSVLGMRYDLNTEFWKEEHIYSNCLCSAGRIVFPNGNIDVSLNHYEKEMQACIYGTKGNVIYDTASSCSLKTMLYDRTLRLESNELIKDSEKYNFPFDENHNLYLAMAYFSKVLRKKKESNIDLAIKVTSVLENLL